MSAHLTIELDFSSLRQIYVDWFVEKMVQTRGAFFTVPGIVVIHR